MGSAVGARKSDRHPYCARDIAAAARIVRNFFEEFFILQKFLLFLTPGLVLARND